MKEWKRFLALFLVALMVTSLVPVSAYAQEGGEDFNLAIMLEGGRVFRHYIDYDAMVADGFESYIDTELAEYYCDYEDDVLYADGGCEAPDLDSLKAELGLEEVEIHTPISKDLIKNDSPIDLVKFYYKNAVQIQAPEENSFKVTYKYIGNGSDGTRLWNNAISFGNLEKGIDPYIAAEYTYKEGEVVPLYMTMPEMDRCTFAGWFSDEEGTKKVTENFEMPGHDVTLYGYYLENKRNDYAVIYKWDGEGIWFSETPDGIIDEKYYCEEYQVSVRDIEAVDGFTFEGWRCDAVAIENGKFIMPSRDIVIKGHYSVNSYNIHYNILGIGEIHPELANIKTPKDFYDSYSMSFGTVDQVWEDLSAEGYTFLGWKTDANVSLDESGFYKVPASNVVWVAEWTKNEDSTVDSVDSTPNPIGPTENPAPVEPEEPAATPEFPAPLNGPVEPVVVNVVENTFPVLAAAADNEAFPVFVVEEPAEPENDLPEIIQVAEEETPLANIKLDGTFFDCILHLLLMLSAMVIYAVYTNNQKKLQLAIHDLEEELEDRRR